MTDCRGRLVSLVLLASCCAFLISPSGAGNRDLKLEDRIRAQEAIERVYYSHQIGATVPFETAVPRSALESKVRAALKESAALEKFWKAPVTAEALAAELERIARATRTPERLEEIYSALDHDPVLIQECFVRPVLADRLARNFFAFDERIHSAARARAEALESSLRNGRPTQSGKEASPASILELVLGRAPDPEGASPGPGGSTVYLSEKDFRRWEKSLPADPGATGSIREEREGFVIPVLLEKSPTRLKVSLHRIPKISWDDWWGETEKDFDPGSVVTVANPYRQVPSPNSHFPGPIGEASGGVGSPEPLPPACPGADSWDNGSLDDVPTARSGFTTVWTGSLMIVWGGVDASNTAINTGRRYDPLTDTWTPTSLSNAPSARLEHVALWAGSRMIVWGGTLVNTGGRYDPITDTWLPTSTLNAPAKRNYPTVVWTGSQMLLWGGNFPTGVDPDGGARYDPVADSWTPISTVNAPNPSIRTNHSAVWTGSLMVVWGGFGVADYTNTGGRYNPATDTWQGLNTSGAPSARRYHSAVWTGSRMVVWGGQGVSGGFAVYPTDGSNYDPQTDQWGPSFALPLAGRQDQIAVWTGSRMIIWGGREVNTSPPNTYYNDGAIYDPSLSQSTLTSTLNAPTARYGHGGVWTGSRMVVWGGAGAQSITVTGGRYDPANDTWTPTSTTGQPDARANHTGVWTGNEMIVWGGRNVSQLFNSGGRYSPLLDSWSYPSTASAPSPRYGHVAVWSGDRMVVWGGTDGTNYFDSGGRYDPVSDSWLPTGISSMTPGPRMDSSALWTGTRMLVWGGYLGYYDTIGAGALYDPVMDTWTQTSFVNAPVGRRYHAAVWTGTEMIVWGGMNLTSTLGDGGRYDPALNQWTMLPATGAPTPRYGPAAVWTGSEMIVWSGQSSGSTGSRYSPASNQWSGMTASNPPPGGAFPATAWTGTEMIVWGGGTSTGGRFNPASNKWTAMTTADAPLGPVHPGSVWTGTMLIVWDGSYSITTGYAMPTAGRYRPDQSGDMDGDGFSPCQGDCDDARASIHPGAAEICDGLDNDCNGAVDEGFPDLDGDGYAGCANDCNDNDPAIHPGAVEICNGVDDNCNGILDDGFPDSDGDGYTACGGDCNDANPAIHPGAVEICNGVDDNCNSVVDEGFDLDGDGYAPCTGDCDESNPAINPGATEICNGIDDNCNAAVDEGFPDKDGDGHAQCVDCNDHRAAVWSVPGEISGLVIGTAVPTNLSWTDPALSAGSETVSEMASGPLSETTGLSFPSATCLMNGGANSYSDTRPNPAVHFGYWYLARASNSCGVGTYGTGTGGSSRSVTACP